MFFFFLLLAACSLTIHPIMSQSIKYETAGCLQCSNSSLHINLGYLSSASTYIVQLQILTQDALPLIMTVWDYQHLDPDIQDGVGFLKGIADVNALELGHLMQRVMVRPTLTHQFWAYLQRLDLTKFEDNLDRVVQGYSGDDDTEIYVCTLDIWFRLTVWDLQVAVTPFAQIISPPFSQSDCNSGTYSENSCHCSRNFATPTCQAQVVNLPGFEKSMFSFFKSESKIFYSFEPADEIFITKPKIQIEINVKGTKSLNFEYNPSKTKPQIVLLWNIQQASSPKNIVSYFSQMNPSVSSQIELVKGQRLIFTVYKPFWGTEETIEVSVKEKASFLTQLVTIIIAACCCLTMLFLFAFVGFMIYNKKRRIREIAIGAANTPDTYGWRPTRTFNMYINIDEHFPSVTYNQIKKIIEQENRNNLKEKEKEEAPCCSICLDIFDSQTIVKWTFCLHVFHSNCLIEWMNRQPNCPLCRKQYLYYDLMLMEARLNIKDLQGIDRYRQLWKACRPEHKEMEVESSYNIRPSQSP